MLRQCARRLILNMLMQARWKLGEGRKGRNTAVGAGVTSGWCWQACKARLLPPLFLAYYILYGFCSCHCLTAAGKPVGAGFHGYLRACIHLKLVYIAEQHGLQIACTWLFKTGQRKCPPNASLLCSAHHRVLNRPQVENIDHVINQIAFGSCAHVLGVSQPCAVLQVLPDCQVLMHNVILHAHTHSCCDVAVA